MGYHIFKSVYFGIFAFMGVSASSFLQEYCDSQTFQAECAKDEVIIMKSALYGRMHLGKCLTRDLGYLGCYGNALSHFDSVCSNERSCDVIVNKVNIPVTSTCPVEMRDYLEAQYKCQKVLQFECSTDIITITSDQTLSGKTLQKCRLSSTTISAKPGQRLNISMMDFSWNSNSKRCQVTIGSVKDVISSNSVDICSGAERGRFLMTSNGNVVEINVRDVENADKFLLYLSVIGCGDLEAPSGTWIQREGDELLMGCHSGKHTWTLKCDGNQWQGARGQCGTDRSMAVYEQRINNNSYNELSLGMIAFAACSILIFISACIFTIGVCVHVSKNKKMNQMPSINDQYTTYQRHVHAMQSSKLLQQQAMEQHNP